MTQEFKIQKFSNALMSHRQFYSYDLLEFTKKGVKLGIPEKTSMGLVKAAIALRQPYKARMLRGLFLRSSREYEHFRSNPDLFQIHDNGKPKDAVSVFDIIYFDHIDEHGNAMYRRKDQKVCCYYYTPSGQACTIEN